MGNEILNIYTFSLKLSLTFDDIKIINQEVGMASYIKKYQDEYVLNIYLNVCEDYINISFYRYDKTKIIFSIAFDNIGNIKYEQDLIQLYNANNILLAELLLQPMPSLKLSI